MPREVLVLVELDRFDEAAAAALLELLPVLVVEQEPALQRGRHAEIPGEEIDVSGRQAARPVSPESMP